MPARIMAFLLPSCHQLSVYLLHTLRPGQPGFSEPLVDREGFPRADVDVYRVRGDRHRHACLRNDYKEVMDALQHALGASAGRPGQPNYAGDVHSLKSPWSLSTFAEDLHSAARAAGNISEGRPRQPAPSGQGADVAGVSTAGARPPMPFAVVDELFEGSPAKASTSDLASVFYTYCAGLACGTTAITQDPASDCCRRAALRWGTWCAPWGPWTAGTAPRMPKPFTKWPRCLADLCPMHACGCLHHVPAPSRSFSGHGKGAATGSTCVSCLPQELPKLEGSRVPVLVQRGSGEVVSFTLVPSSAWGGRGLLGCHLTLIRP